MLGDGVQDDFAEWEREQITERTTAGRREKARQGKIIAGRLADYGFRFGPERDSYEVAEEELEALEERRSRVRELEVSRERILARYRVAAPEKLEKADGNKRRAVYNTLGLTIRAARTEDDPIRIVLSALGGEEFCQEDATSRRSFSSANPRRLGLTLLSKDGELETAFHLDHNARGGFRK